MSEQDLKPLLKNDDLANTYSFRALLCRNFGYENINFSMGGSSNQTQFRLAENFFSSPYFRTLQTQCTDIKVLWGITSVFRGDAYFRDFGKQQSFMYSNNSMLSKIILSDHFDQDNEVFLLSKKIRFWNNFFNTLGIKNLWFDTFNHHDYVNGGPEDPVLKENYQLVSGPDWPSWEAFIAGDMTDVKPEIISEILDPSKWIFYRYFYDPIENFFNRDIHPRDLLSQLVISHGLSFSGAQYHYSSMKDDGDCRINYVKDKGIVNPYSWHPTKQGHIEIAEMLSKSNFFD